MRALTITLTILILSLVMLTACGQTKNNKIENKQTIQKIKFVFDDYVKYQESTDSENDKDLMTKSLKSLNKVKELDELEILINVWMYYDPTDFQSTPEVYRILKNSRPESIEAVKQRIKNKKEWESVETAPYSELNNLLQRLEDE